MVCGQELTLFYSVNPFALKNEYNRAPVIVHQGEERQSEVNYIYLGKIML